MMTPDALNNPQPSQPLTPEEDPALLAIEAREAREGDLDRPLSRPIPRVQPRSAPRTIVKETTPLVIEPVLPPPSATPPPAPVVAKPAPRTQTPAKPEPVKEPEATKSPVPTPVRKAKERVEPHWKHSTDIAEVLADAPPVISSRGLFKPFANQVRSHKGTYVTIAAIIILALGAGVYFFLQR